MDLQVLKTRARLATARKPPVLRAACVAAAVALATSAFVACAGSNGDAVPSEVFDAAPLDSRSPSMPFDSGVTPDPLEAGVDARADAPSGDAGGDAGSSAVVRINEVYADNDGLGDGAEYVELVAPPGTPVDDLKLRLVYADGTPKYEVAVGSAGEKVSASGLWVVGGNQVFKVAARDKVDTVVSINNWGLDGTRGVVQLLRGPQRTLIDVVGYDRDPDAGALAPIASPPTQTSEGAPAVAPTTARKAFGRKAAAVDTNVNRVDFCAMDPTPGYPQGPCL
ncbi:MAG: hypothetical protein KC657_35555 [Myxococcales bacterium]|nr:hypothetical protein [Myxococcales bacterium]